MVKESESFNRPKTDGCLFNKFYGKKSVSFCFNSGKHLFLEV